MNTRLYALAGAILAGTSLNTGGFCPPAYAASEGRKMAVQPASLFQLAMDKSMAAMDHAIMAAPMNGHPDHDFVSMMIPHHRGAVDMARVELLYGTDPVLQRLAQGIIVDQQQEIITIRRRTDHHHLPARRAAHSPDRTHQRGPPDPRL